MGGTRRGGGRVGLSLLAAQGLGGSWGGLGDRGPPCSRERRLHCSAAWWAAPGRTPRPRRASMGSGAARSGRSAAINLPRCRRATRRPRRGSRSPSFACGLAGVGRQAATWRRSGGLGSPSAAIISRTSWPRFSLPCTVLPPFLRFLTGVPPHLNRWGRGGRRCLSRFLPAGLGEVSLEGLRLRAQLTYATAIGG